MFDQGCESNEVYGEQVEQLYGDDRLSKLNTLRA